MHNHNPYYTGLGLETAFEMGTIALASMVYKRMRVRIRGSGSEAVLGAGNHSVGVDGVKEGTGHDSRHRHDH